MGGQNISEDWTRFGKKQILSIGKKRQRIHDEDDEIADDAVGGHGYGSSSDEEEGRTSAVKDKKRKVRHPPPLPTPAAAVAGSNAVTSSDAIVAASTLPSNEKKKKKKGKKERAKENAEEVNISTGDAGSAVGTENVQGHGGGDPDRNTDATKNDKDPAKDNAAATATATKRKRKKARSRQKNIRKDNRTADDRPSRLVLGSADYSGRPMTKETKKRLGVEEKNDAATTKRNAKRNASSSADAAFDGGQWIGGKEIADKDDDADADGEGGDAGEVGQGVSKSPEPRGEEASSEGLVKIGDCIVDRNAAAFDDSNKMQDVGEGVVDESKDMKKKGKKRKRKFKNLVVG